MHWLEFFGSRKSSFEVQMHSIKSVKVSLLNGTLVISKVC